MRPLLLELDRRSRRVKRRPAQPGTPSYEARRRAFARTSIRLHDLTSDRSMNLAADGLYLKLGKQKDHEHHLKKKPPAPFGWGILLRDRAKIVRQAAESLPPPTVLFSGEHATIPCTGRLGMDAAAVWTATASLRQRWNRFAKKAQSEELLLDCYYSFEIVRLRARKGRGRSVAIHVHAFGSIPRETADQRLLQLWREQAGEGGSPKATARLVRNLATGEQDAASRSGTAEYVVGLLHPREGVDFPKGLAAFIDWPKWLDDARARKERNLGRIDECQLWMYLAFYAAPGRRSGGTGAFFGVERR
jgi:hypothetical protein